LCNYYYFYLINCFSNFRMFTFLRYSSSNPIPSTNLQYAESDISLLVAISSKKSFNSDSNLKQIAASICIVIPITKVLLFSIKKMLYFYLLNLLNIDSRSRICLSMAKISASMGSIWAAAFARASMTSGSLS